MTSNRVPLQTSRKATIAPALLAGFAATVIILLWGSLRSPRNAFDDAFITYRYADNLRRGLGLVYNPGEWVLGTTAPLYALVLGSLRWLGGTVEWWGHWVSVLGWVVSAWAIMRQLWQHQRRAAGVLAALFVAVIPLMVPTLGMETGFYLALLWLTSWAWMRDSRALAPVLSALAILTRQDAVLFVGLLLLAKTLSSKGVPWREVLLLAGLLTPWFVYAFWRYGTVVPNSALAKINQNTLMRVGGGKAFLQQYLVYFSDRSALAALVLGIALLVGVYVIIRAAREWWWVPCWVAAYVAAYFILNVNSFPWYFVPPLTGSLVVCAIGLGAFLGDGPLPATRATRRAGAMLAVLCAIIIVAIYGKSAFADSVQNQPGYQREYRDVASWLRANTQPSDRTAAIEIGVIGYGSGRPILDTMGLVSPQMRGHLVGWVETLVYAVSEYSPEYVVALGDTGWGEVTSQWWFLDRYTPVANFGRATIYKRYASSGDLTRRVNADVQFPAGFSVKGLESSGLELTPGEPITMTLDVQVTRNPGQKCRLTAYLVDSATYERSGVRDEEPYGGGYGCAAWQPGDRLRIPLRILTPEQIRPGAYQLGVEFTELETGEHFTLASDPAADALQLGWFRAGNPEQPQFDGQKMPAGAQWENGITLDSVAIGNRMLTPGAAMSIKLEWRAATTPERDLTFFVHLLDSAGQIVAQSDRRPFDGRFPTTVWHPGEKIEDVYAVTPPQGMPAGEYSLRVGFYDALGRLPLTGGGGDTYTMERVFAVGGQ